MRVGQRCRVHPSRVLLLCLLAPRAKSFLTPLCPTTRRAAPYSCTRQHNSSGGKGRANKSRLRERPSTGWSADGVPSSERDSHNTRQQEIFEKWEQVERLLEHPEDVTSKLEAIVDATQAPEGGTVVDVGTGTGVLLPFLEERRKVAPQNVTGIDLSATMLEIFEERHSEATAVRSDFVDWTPPPGVLADSVIFNAVFGNVFDQRQQLAHAADVLKVGGTAVISHPLGADFVKMLGQRDPSVVPHPLPSGEQLKKMTEFLPLTLSELSDEPDFYLATLTRMHFNKLAKCVYLRGEVSQGYGRGSKKIGVPTANLPESLFNDALENMPTGVYFGWGLVEGAEGEAQEPQKVIANVGYSPSFEGKENPEKIVEAHVIDYSGEDFYGQTLRLVLVGFQRRERKFASFPELVQTITGDVSDARALLDQQPFSAFKADGFLGPSGAGEGGEGGAGGLVRWREKAFGEALKEAEEGAEAGG